MTNYIQIMTTTLSYNMNLPDVLSNVFSPLSVLGSGTTTVFFQWIDFLRIQNLPYLLHHQQHSSYLCLQYYQFCFDL